MPADDLTIEPDSTLEEEIEYNTLISKFENGVEQRRSLRASSLRKFKLLFKNRPLSDYSTIKSLFDTKLGAFSTLLWTNPNDSTQYTVRFEKDTLNVARQRFNTVDFEFSLQQVK